MDYLRHSVQLARWRTGVGGLLLLAVLCSMWPATGRADTESALWLPYMRKANMNPVHQGIATYYTATGAGACSSSTSSPGDLMVAAMNAEEYANAGVCGAHVDVTGPGGQVRVRIVDLVHSQGRSPGPQPGGFCPDRRPGAGACADCVAGGQPWR